jgi:hypothetical protein
MKDPETEKFIREQRIKERAQKLYEESKLPPNMHKNEQKMNKRKEERIKALEKELFEFDRRPKRRDKPNFEKLHKDFSTKLDSKKKEFKPSKVVPFHLTEAKERPVDFEEEKIEPNKLMKMMVGAALKTSKKAPPVPTTKKMNEALERKKQREKEEELSKKQREQEETQKKKRISSLKSIVQTKIAMEDHTQEKKLKRKEELEEKKLSNKIEEMKTKKHIDEVIKKGKDRTLQVDGYESTSEIMKRFRSVRNTMETLNNLGVSTKPKVS